MQRVWVRIRDFVLSPIGLAASILCALLLLLAGFLWFREVSYAHPGPARATALLAVVVLLLGWVIVRLQAQRRGDRAPCLLGLELLTGRWRTFESQPSDSAILHEQFLITLSVAQLAYNQYEQIRFIRYFPGFKIRGGAFLIQPGQSIPRVFKFGWCPLIACMKRVLVMDNLLLFKGVPEVRWDAIAEQLFHCPDVICNAGCHSRGDGLPFLR